MVIFAWLLFAKLTLQSPPIPEGSDQPSRILQTTGAHNLTWVIDSSFLDRSDLNRANYFENYIVPAALRNMRDIFQVNGNPIIPSFNSVNGCFNDALIPAQYLTTSTSGDLLLFIALNGHSNSPKFSSRVCVRAANGRPIVGLLYGNPAFLVPNHNNTVDLIKSSMAYLSRMFAFSLENFNFFPGGSAAVYVSSTRNTINGEITANKVIIPSVVSFAQSYFNCTTMDGIFLEDFGATASADIFWESTMLGFEYLTATPAYDAPISMFSLLVLQASNWYSVNLLMAEYLEFGRNGGCQFLDLLSCGGSSPEFCSVEGLNTCSRFKNYRTICTLSEYGNGCKLNLPSQNSRCAVPVRSFHRIYDDETPGATSKCQSLTIGSLQSSACLSTMCNLNGTVATNFSSVESLCNTTSQAIQISSNMQLNCPSFHSICLQSGCASQCYGNGNCRENNTCSCNYFYTGDNCQQYAPCTNSTSTICPLSHIANATDIPSIPIQIFNLTFGTSVLKLSLAFGLLKIMNLFNF